MSADLELSKVPNGFFYRLAGKFEFDLASAYPAVVPPWPRSVRDPRDPKDPGAFARRMRRLKYPGGRKAKSALRWLARLRGI